MPLSILGESGASNTGQILGDAAKGVIRQLAIFGGKLTAAETADAAALQAALSAKSLLPRTDSNKFFLLPEVLNFEDRAEQNTTGALNLGPTVMLKEGKAGYEIKCSGTSEYAKRMRGWNNKTIGIVELDANNKAWGYQSGTDFRGYTAQIFVNAMRVASGQAPEEQIVTITISFLSAVEYGNQSKCLDLSQIDTGLIKTQNDAALSQYAAKAGSTYKISIGIPLGEMNKVYDVVAKFPAVAAVGNFEAGWGKNYATPVAVSAVSVNADGQLDVTLTDAAVTVGSKIRLNLKAPSVLEAAGVTDIEGVAVILTK